MEIFNFISLDQVLIVVLRTVIIFIFAFFILRLLGKRSLSHFTYLDLLLIVALGSAVGDVMIYEESIAQLFSSIVAISVVGFIVKFLNETTSHFKKVEKLVVGEARLIIKDSKVIKEALSQEDMSESELRAVLRIKGFENYDSIKKAFIESDGEVSIITKSIDKK